MVESMLVLNERHWGTSSPLITPLEFSLKNDDRYVLTCKLSPLRDKENLRIQHCSGEDLQSEEECDDSRRGSDVQHRSPTPRRVVPDDLSASHPGVTVKRSELSYVTPTSLRRNGSSRRKICHKDSKGVARKLSVMIAPSTVSIIASKFNALIEKDLASSSKHVKPACVGAKHTQSRVPNLEQDGCVIKNKRISHVSDPGADKSVLDPSSDRSRVQDCQRARPRTDVLATSPRIQPKLNVPPGKKLSIYSKVHKIPGTEMKLTRADTSEAEQYGRISNVSSAVLRGQLKPSGAVNQDDQVATKVIDRFTYNNLRGIVRNKVKTFESKQEKDNYCKPGRRLGSSSTPQPVKIDSAQYQKVRAKLKQIYEDEGQNKPPPSNPPLHTSPDKSLLIRESKIGNALRDNVSAVTDRSPSNYSCRPVPSVDPYLISPLPREVSPSSGNSISEKINSPSLNQVSPNEPSSSVTLCGVTTDESSTDDASKDYSLPLNRTPVLALKGRTIKTSMKPNLSFLWGGQRSESDLTSFSEETYMYDDIQSSRVSKTYLEVIPTQTLLDSLEQVSVKESSDIDYDDCRSNLPYEDCNPGVYEECNREESKNLQIGEINSAFYEDISVYNDSHSYEPIYAPNGEVLVPAVLKDPVQPVIEAIPSDDESCDKYGDHQVMSYQINQPEAITTTEHAASEVESDGWMDASETESSANGDTMIVAEVQLRAKNQREKSKNFRRSWSRSFRKANESMFDADSESDNHYEVISRGEERPEVNGCSEVTPNEDIEEEVFNDVDSFDSASEDELNKSNSWKVNGKISQVGSQRPNSASSIDDRGQSIYGLNKIAETAGEKIKKLKRNWSLTKSDIRQELNRGLNRIRKKSVDNELVNKDKKMSTWSLTERFRRKSSPGKTTTRETATFYLTMTLKKEPESEESDFRRSDTDSCKSSITPKSKSKFRVSRSAPQTPTDQVNKEKSFLRNGAPKGRKPRPTTAPPEPPLPKKNSLNPVFPEMRPSLNEKKWKSDTGTGMRSVLDRKSFQDRLEEILSGRTAPGQDDSQISSQVESDQRAETDAQEGTNYAKVVSFLSSSESIPNSSPETPCDNNNHYVCSQFADEPLYQFYTANILERDLNDLEDNYEVIAENLEENMMSLRVSAMELINPSGPQRTLWCELPEVKASGVMNTMTVEEVKRQEAILEVITSEASYLKSLHVLVRHFVQCPEFTSVEKVLSRRERVVLFSDIIPVKTASENLLRDLEARWKASLIVEDIADIIYEHATQNFSVYVKYCSNQLYQERLLNELMESRPEFTEVLKRLESDIVCQSLSMHSFLMLPMQRITRLPLLMDAIFHRTEPASEQYNRNKLALATLNKVVHDCNEGARKMERMEEMLKLTRVLDFSGVRAVPLISASRWLVKKGELTRLVWRDLDTHRKLKRPSKQVLHIFLFTDLLVVTKRKGSSSSDESFHVLDYCQRNMVHLEEIDEQEMSLYGKPPDGPVKLLSLTMLENKDRKTVEMILSCNAESDRTRWIEAVTPRGSDNPDEVVYESWDCPQVNTTHPYTARQPDELSLEMGDVVNVLKKTVDGWYQGERIRDGEKGWFPGTYCHEIASAHVRARNLRQRHRLLTLSGTYVDEMIKKDVPRKGRRDIKKLGNSPERGQLQRHY